MTTTDKKTKNAAIIAVVAAIVALVIASCSVFAWFLIADRNTAGDLGLTVVDSANIDLSVSIGGNSGNLTFNDVVPGSVFEMKLELKNYSTDIVHFNLFFYDLKKTIYQYLPDKDPIPENGIAYSGVDMLDVFAVSSEQLGGLAVLQNNQNLYEKFKNPVYFNTICDPERNKVTLLSGFPLPGKDDTEEEVNTILPSWYGTHVLMETGFSKTTIIFQVRFMNTITNDDGTQKTTAVLNGQQVDININIFQRQQFYIRVLQVEEVSSTTF